MGADVEATYPDGSVPEDAAACAENARTGKVLFIAKWAMRHDAPEASVHQADVSSDIST